MKCRLRPRAAAGKLTRCLLCVKADAEANRLEREAIRKAQTDTIDTISSRADAEDATLIDADA